MTRERIEDMREIVLPFVKKRLLETNYENLGESDAEEFAREFNEILNLAIKALEQEPQERQVMDMYGTGEYNNDKNILYDDIKEFLEKHAISELMQVISDVIKYQKELTYE